MIYGHGADTVHVTLPGHDLMMALKTANALISLDIDGRNELVIPKAVVRNPIKGFIEHVDLLAVKRGEKVTVEVAVHTEGELAPGANLLENVLNTLTVEAEATNIPTSVTVSIEGLEAGASIHAKDVPLPSGTTLVTPEDAVVIQILAAQAEEPHGRRRRDRGSRRRGLIRAAARFYAVPCGVAGCRPSPRFFVLHPL